MVCCCLFHLDLHFAIAWVDVIELFLAALAGVGLFFGIEKFVEMKQGALPAEIQSQVVQSGVGVAWH